MSHVKCSAHVRIWAVSCCTKWPPLEREEPIPAEDHLLLRGGVRHHLVDINPAGHIREVWVLLLQLLHQPGVMRIPSLPCCDELRPELKKNVRLPYVGVMVSILIPMKRFLIDPTSGKENTLFRGTMA